MPLPLSLAFWLLAALTLKHFIADFLLQTRWMATGKEAPQGWALPLACHAGLHGLGTTFIALMLEPAAWWLGVVDMVVHAVIDVAKARTGQHFRLQPDQPAYWWLFGLDQFLHQLTNLGLAMAMLMVLAA
jgi:hypothetical protein